jgi:hypothetical protein
MFFSNDFKKPSWKVVLQKEVHFRRKVVNTKDVFITTTMETNDLSAPIGLLPAPNTASLIGAIKLLEKDNLLASTKF